MLRPTFGLARAVVAAGALLVSGLVTPALRADEPTADTVSVLSASRDGLIDLTVRGQGQEHVKFTLRNTAGRRLNVVFPPGLVAAATVGQGGFQSMGLGTPTRTAGSFGEFRGGTSGEGFRSVPNGSVGRDLGVAVPADDTLDVLVPSVCLNFGIPTPTPKDVFTLMSVEDYTPDLRARKALKSLATLGTSQRVAQAVAWNVFNGMTFPQMAAQRVRVINGPERALAARFIEALDASTASDLVDPEYFRSGRVLVHVSGPSVLEKDVAALSRELEGETLLGLPVRVVESLPGDEVGPSALLVEVSLAAPNADQLRIKANLRTRVGQTGWASLGQISVPDIVSHGQLSAHTLSAALDRSIASHFVNVRTARRGNGTTTFRLENRLPFTIAHATLRAGKGPDAELLPVTGLGLGPARATLTQVPAANVAVERVELNGL